MHTLIKHFFAMTPDGQTQTAAGWVRTRRDSKAGFSFIELNDGSCFQNLQVIASREHLANYDHEVRHLHPGASISVTGKLMPSQGGGQTHELVASSLTVHGFADPETYPLGKQRITLERLRELPHLRARTNTFGAVARIRNLLAFQIHAFFQSRDFLYLHTPIITANDCEGASAMFRVTTLDPATPPRNPDNTVNFKADFFTRPTSLSVSGQLEGETYACGLGPVYTFGPTFRAENSNTRRHLAEFWMVEPEIPFASLDDDAQLATDMLHHLFRAVVDNAQADLAFFDERFERGLVERLAFLADAKFERMTYTQAIHALQGAREPFEFPVHWGMDLQSEHERWLTEKHLKTPVIVTDYPKDIKAFYMRQNDDEKTVAAMDVLVPGVGEIIGGSQREERLPLLLNAMAAHKLNPDDYSWYLDLRRFGSVPHAGFGLGFERLIQFCTGLPNIRDTIPYPRAPGLCD